MLASSGGISSWISLKPQHSNPNPNPFTNQLWCIDFLTPPTLLIIPHRLPAFLEALMPPKNWCSIHARCSKSSLKHSIRFSGIFFKQNFIAYRSSKVSSRPDCIFEIHQALVGCIPTGCNPEDLLEAMNDREKCREMVKDIRAGGTTWWWWWWWFQLLL